MDNHIVCLVRMRSEDEGGRHAPLDLDYCPDLIVRGTSERLPVRVCAVPAPIYPGGSGSVTFEAIFRSACPYEALGVGSHFAMMEGPREVGQGSVRSLSQPMKR